MTIDTPAAVNISTDSQLLLPGMKQQPLLRALQNCNFIIKHHRPPLVADSPVSSYGISRSSTYVTPITPSQDNPTSGIRYTFVSTWVCSHATQSCTLSVDYTTAYAGGGTTWANIFSQATVSVGAGTVTIQTKADQSIPTNAVALRFVLTAPASGTRADHDFFVYPSPPDTVAGITASGAVPFDDGGLSHVDEWAVHTEFINRCKTTASAVLRDRKQRALSFLAEELSAGYSRTTIDEWSPLPAVRVFLPYQVGDVELDVFVLAQVSAGGTTDLIRVEQIDGQMFTTDADGAINSSTLTVTTKGAGAFAHADLRISLLETAGNTTIINAVCAYYTPGT